MELRWAEGGAKPPTSFGFPETEEAVWTSKNKFWETNLNGLGGCQRLSYPAYAVSVKPLK